MLLSTELRIDTGSKGSSSHREAFCWRLGQSAWPTDEKRREVRVEKRSENISDQKFRCSLVALEIHGRTRGSIRGLLSRALSKVCSFPSRCILEGRTRRAGRRGKPQISQIFWVGALAEVALGGWIGSTRVAWEEGDKRPVTEWSVRSAPGGEKLRRCELIPLAPHQCQA
jgi:hypothetical protein